MSRTLEQQDIDLRDRMKAFLQQHGGNELVFQRPSTPMIKAEAVELVEAKVKLLNDLIEREGNGYLDASLIHPTWVARLDNLKRYKPPYLDEDGGSGANPSFNGSSNSNNRPSNPSGSNPSTRPGGSSILNQYAERFANSFRGSGGPPSSNSHGANSHGKP